MALLPKYYFKKKDLLTIPNLLSLTRIILTPFIVYFWLHQFLKITGILLVFCLTSDFFDGLIARKFNQISNLGKVLDPIADKIFIVSLIVTVGTSYLSPLQVSLIVILEFLLAFSPTLNFHSSIEQEGRFEFFWKDKNDLRISGSCLDVFWLFSRLEQLRKDNPNNYLASNYLCFCQFNCPFSNTSGFLKEAALFKEKN